MVNQTKSKKNLIRETVNLDEVKARLSQLLDVAASGEEVIIARAGKPMAKLIPYRTD